MQNFGIIDDRDQQRGTLASSFSLAIQALDKEEQWSVLDTRPFVKVEDYVSWINLNKISILIIDEKLYEDISNGEKVNYKGSDLVDFLRTSFKGMPIYAISSFSDDEELQSKFSSFDDIINRDQYDKNSEEYIQRFLRAGEGFLDGHLKELSELTILSQKIASNNFTDKDVEKANAIQKDLEIPFTIQEAKSRRDWLKSYESEINTMAELQEQIKKYIQDN
jgi:hypothetical protein